MDSRRNCEILETNKYQIHVDRDDILFNCMCENTTVLSPERFNADDKWKAYNQAINEVLKKLNRNSDYFIEEVQLLDENNEMMDGRSFEVFYEASAIEDAKTRVAQALI